MRPALVLALVLLPLSGGVLALAGVLSILPVTVEALRSRDDLSSSAWTPHVSADLAGKGIRVWAIDKITTGSGFSCCPTTYLPGSNSSDRVSDAYIFQQTNMPSNVDRYEFNLYSNGIGEVGGVGNRFMVELCSSSPRCETPEQMVQFELFRCFQGDMRCSDGSGGWMARLIVSSDFGRNTKMDTTTVENLTRAQIVSIHILLYGYSQRVDAFKRSLGQANTNFDISYEFTDQIFNRITTGTLLYSLNVYNISYTSSKLSGVKLDFSAACISCTARYFTYGDSSFVNIDRASYRVEAPALSVLGLDSLGGGVILTSLAAVPTAAVGLYLFRRRLGWIRHKGPRIRPIAGF